MRQEIQRMLRHPDVGLKPFTIQNVKDLSMVEGKIANMVLTPIIPISNVTGEGLHIVRQLLLSLPQRRQHAKVGARPRRLLLLIQAIRSTRHLTVSTLAVSFAETTSQALRVFGRRHLPRTRSRNRLVGLCKSR